MISCHSSQGGVGEDCSTDFPDSLNVRAYVFKYRNVDSVAQWAKRAYEWPRATPSQRAEALNSLGFAAFMQMDYHLAEERYRQVYEVTNSEIERLTSDVGMMRVCQRTSANKRFFDYRNRAQKRIQRIREEYLELPLRDNLKMLSAEAAYHLISATYFNDLQQQHQRDDEMNLIEPTVELQRDTAQWLYYTYMKGTAALSKGETEDDLVQRFANLNRLLQVSDESGYVWFQALSLQALSEFFMEKNAGEVIAERRRNAMQRLNPENLSPGELSLSLAGKALELFESYGDCYRVIDAYRTLASCLNRLEDYSTALLCLNEALSLINRDYLLHNEQPDSTALLSLYQPQDTVELLWVNNERVVMIPELILRVREQISVAFSGLGDKEASDFNRNIYLDMLKQIRQNREYYSRAGRIEEETRVLNHYFILLLVVLMAGTFGLFYLGGFWKKRNRKHIGRLRSVLSAGKRIMTAVPGDVSDRSQVSEWVIGAVAPTLTELFGPVKVDICLAEKEEEEERSRVASAAFLLQSPDGNKNIGRLLLGSRQPLDRNDRTTVQLLIPFVAAAVENGLTYVELGDEYRRIEKEHYLYQQHLEVNKCENIVKKSCFSLVTGIAPYMDRMVNEVHKLLLNNPKIDEESRKRKYLYINELIDKINEYNDIISLWVKMRQGALSLHIGNFELNTLFVTLQKSRQTFDLRCLTLTVEPTDAVVKADKALTLFMLNTLADNARKYTPAGGTVTLKAYQTNDYVEVSVCDTGVGLSQIDIARILGEKVYDSRLIGSDNEQSKEIAKNKGNGFGILNCKGIIEKYRKSDPLFKVCRFGIESEPGRGSRFFFRLPKGARRLFLSVTGWLVFSVILCAPSDLILQKASDFTDSVYICNTRGEYLEALAYADSAFSRLNACYALMNPGRENFLRLSATGEAAEMEWWREKFAVDSLIEEIYFNILDIRNEVAVASLALKRWDDYYYNDRAYSNLFRLVHEDHSLAEYCDNMERSANNKQVAMVLCLLSVVIVLVVLYISYFRQWILCRINLRQALDVSKQLFSAPLWSAQEANNSIDLTAQRVVQRIFPGMNDLLSLRQLTVAVYNDEKQQLCMACKPDGSEPDKWFDTNISLCFKEQHPLTSEDAVMCCLPLTADGSGEKHCVGVLAYMLNGRVQEGEKLMGELIAGYVSVAVYNSTVKLAKKYRDIEQMQDDARRAIHEENKLHVQNQVLDNCLSVIKHETVYYPNRIKQIVRQLMDEKSPRKEAETEKIRSIGELVDYYKDIFTTLSMCAARQIDEITFRRSNVSVRELAEYASDYAAKAVKRAGVSLRWNVRVGEERVVCDLYLLRFLLQNLIDEAVTCALPGEIELNTCTEREYVKFSFTDMRRNLSPEELSQLFVPSLQRMYSVGNGTLKGAEYLICKQIIREHDEYIGHRGCRIDAVAHESGGFTVRFTIPKKNNE